jgi:hypothetical protein
MPGADATADESLPRRRLVASGIGALRATQIAAVSGPHSATANEIAIQRPNRFRGQFLPAIELCQKSFAWNHLGCGSKPHRGTTDARYGLRFASAQGLIRRLTGLRTPRVAATQLLATIKTHSGRAGDAHHLFGPVQRLPEQAGNECFMSPNSQRAVLNPLSLPKPREFGKSREFFNRGVW